MDTPSFVARRDSRTLTATLGVAARASIGLESFGPKVLSPRSARPPYEVFYDILDPGAAIRMAGRVQRAASNERLVPICITVFTVFCRERIL